MSQPDDGKYGMIYIAVGLFGTFMLAGLAGWMFSVWIESKQDQAIDDMVAEQTAEGQHYTAIVESVDMSNGVATLDNGDKMDISDLQGTPSVGDILTYTKSFEYIVIDWSGFPKKTGDTTYLDVKSIGHTAERAGKS